MHRCFFLAKARRNQQRSCCRRFAAGSCPDILAASVTFRLHPALSGAIVGLLISLPEALAMKSYAGSLGTGLVFGALTGLAVKLWVT